MLVVVNCTNDSAGLYFCEDETYCRGGKAGDLSTNDAECNVVLTESRTPRFTTLLAAALVGVYLLVVIGATAALAEAVRACSTWPLCSGPLTDPQIAIAIGHRIAAVLVAVLVVASAVIGWPSASHRVKGTLVSALTLYPIQVVVGAFVATTGAPSRLAGFHLTIGTAIFVSLALALAWQLEDETGHAIETQTTSTTPTPRTDISSSATTSTSVSSGASSSASTESVDASSSDSATVRSHSPGVFGRTKATIAAYFQLMKPRLMWLLCLVASAGMALAAGSSLSVETVLLTLGGGVLSIGASGTFNHVIERDIDQQMDRTADRPLATHQVPVRNALAFGVLLTVASIALFYQVNVFAAALGFVAIVFYSVIYTLVLKPNTVQNTVLGGAAGALPALIGWVAVTGRIGIPGLALAGVIFLWTPAHFYNLALAYKEDYERGGFPMMPIVRGDTATRKHIVYYLAATLLAASGLAALTTLGWLYAVTTVTLGAVFLWMVIRLHREQTKRAALRSFHASNAYLGAVLVAVLIDTLVL
jgi:protoheme IX farnesyltransferase